MEAPPHALRRFAPGRTASQLIASVSRAKEDKDVRAGTCSRWVLTRPSNLRARLQPLFARILALVSCTLLGAGAPPSEFAPQDSVWWVLEPLMWPGLFAGVGLALLAALGSCIAPRVGAILCLAACASTGVGVVAAAGISAQYPARAALFDGTLLAIPVLMALDALRLVNRLANGESGRHG